MMSVGWFLSVNLDKETINMVKDRRFKVLRNEEEFYGDEDGKIILGPQRFNIMGAEYFMADILSTLGDIYGQGAGGILRKTGMTYGNDLLDVIDTDQDTTQIIGDLFGLLAFLGYSNIHVEDDDTVVVPSSPTADSFKDMYDDEMKACYFLAGILTAAVRLIDEDYTMTETACQADGDDVCRFMISGTEDN